MKKLFSKFTYIDFIAFTLAAGGIYETLNNGFVAGIYLITMSSFFFGVSMIVDAIKNNKSINLTSGETTINMNGTTKIVGEKE